MIPPLFPLELGMALAALDVLILVGAILFTGHRLRRRDLS